MEFDNTSAFSKFFGLNKSNQFHRKHLCNETFLQRHWSMNDGVMGKLGITVG